MKRRTRIILLGVLICLTTLIVSHYGAQSFSAQSFSAQSFSTSSAVNRSLVFSHQVVDPSPTPGADCCLDVLAVGDIDGDSQADIMVGAENSIGAAWYHYPTWKQYAIAFGEFTTDGEIADVDRDGDGDVVISSISRDAIEWWENTGNPFQAKGWLRHEIGSRFSHDVAVGDLNGDGNLDVAILRKDEPRQLTWFAASDDPRQAWTRHQVDTPPGEGLDLADIDGDGDLDIAGSVNWYENLKGTGLTWTKHLVVASWGKESRDIIADMNRDGRKDIILSHAEGDGRVSWFENPTWQEHAIESHPLRGAHSLEVGDFDLDSDLDVFVGEMNTGVSHNVMVYKNLGGAISWQKIILATTGTHNGRTGDIDDDGDLDIVGKNYTGNKVVELWRNKTKAVSGRSRDKLKNTQGLSI